MRRDVISVVLCLLASVVLGFAGCSGGGGGGGSTDSTATAACVQVSQGNSTVKVVNSTNSMIQVYFGTSVGFGADLAPGECNLVGIQLPSSYTLQTQVEITQCTPAAGGGCGAKFGSTKYVSLTLPVGQTQTISVDSNFFTSSGGNTNTTHSMSGTVTANGVGLSGVTMTLSGAGSDTATTDSSGNFTFTGVANGNYTVTPLKAGYTFSPSWLIVGVIGLDEVGVNFTATTTTASTSSIVGTVTVSGSGLSGVTLTLSGSGTGSATTDSSGNYTLSGVANGSYTVTPSMSGYTFTPTSLSVTVNGANQTGKNFTATASTTSYLISGAVTSSGVGLYGVKVTLCSASTRSATTNANGNYTFTGIVNGSYMVTPSLSGYVFTPDRLSVTVSGADQIGKNFVASLSSSVSSSWSLWKLPDTGQTACYDMASIISCPAPGNALAQDGSYSINSPSYTDNGNGTVTDSVTTLMWQKEDDNTARNWATATSYCNELVIDCYSDWRLPSIIELATIVDSSRYGPAINTTYFPNAKPASYWSSTDRADSMSQHSAWLVDFNNGVVDSYGNLYTYYVRCVRGGQ